MSDKIELCPFCGHDKPSIEHDRFQFSDAVRCDNFKCPMYTKSWMSLEAWNTRPSPWIKLDGSNLPDEDVKILMDHGGAKCLGCFDGKEWWDDRGCEIIPPDAYMPIPKLP